MVRDVVSKLIEDGKVSRGYMGVAISKVTKQMQPLYNHKEGAVITDIQPGGASDKAGLKRGDLIYAVNGKGVDSPVTCNGLLLRSSLIPRQIFLSKERRKS